jgi:hypothetical protein
MLGRNLRLLTNVVPRTQPRQMLLQLSTAAEPNSTANMNSNSSSNTNSSSHSIIVQRIENDRRVRSLARYGICSSSDRKFSLKHYFIKFRKGPVTYLVSGAITCRVRLSVKI